MSYNRPEYLEKDSVFVQKIETDTNICNNCYRKIREHTDSMHEVASSITEYEDHVEFGYFDDFKTGRASVHESYCECGAVDWNEFRVRPMDMMRMKRSSQRIIERLEEKDFAVDEEKFLSIIESKGNLPEYQFKEEEVFEEAVCESAEKTE